MSPIITDALIAGARESAKLLLLWLLIAAWLRGTGRPEGLIKWFYLSVALALATVFGIALSGSLAILKPFMPSLTGYVFFLFFIASIITLFELLPIRLPALAGPGLVAVSVAYLAPDLISTYAFISELALMKAAPAAVYGSFALGAAAPIALMALRPQRLAHPLSAYMGTGQLLLVMALVKLVAGGAGGEGKFSLLPVVQRGVMKFTHDAVHQTFVYLLVPDHPVLTLTTWNFIGIFFGSNFGLFVALSALIGPMAYYLYATAVAPVAGLELSGSAAERRLIRAGARRERTRMSVPAIAFIVTVLVFWVVSGGKGEIASYYNPAPKPVVVDKGLIIIPLTDPTMDLRDGRIHKFAALRGQDNVAFFVMKKPDGKLSVCMDACEICPPQGYGQSAEFVVCLFCRTPISISSLGKPGGCNPIPLRADITDRDIRVNVSELDSKWSDVKAQKGMGEVNR